MNQIGSSRTAPSADVPPGGAAVILIFMLAIVAASFWINQNCLMASADGVAWRQIIQAQADLKAPFADLGVDPVRGNFDAWVPVRRDYLAPVLLKMLVEWDVAASPGPAFVYSVYASLVLLATYLAGRVLGFARAPALIGAFLTFAAMFPGPASSWLYPLLTTNPHIAQIAALSLVIVAAFWAIRDEWRPVNVALILLPAAATVVAIVSLGVHALLMGPAVMLYGAASLLDGPNWRVNRLRVLAAALAIVLPLLLGLGHYLYSLAGYSAYRFFDGELAQLRNSARFASTLFVAGPASKVVIALGYAGAAWAVQARPGRLRRFAVVHLLTSLAFTAGGYALVMSTNNYQGLSPVYFELAFWPYTLLFAGVATVEPLRWLAARIFGPASPVVLGHRAMALVALPVLAIEAHFALVKWYGSRTCQVHFVPRETAITTALQGIATDTGRPFGGLAATITGIGGKESRTWLDLFGRDVRLWRETGNEHRFVGLWEFRIPTLFHYFSTRTPSHHLVVTDFLARPRDRHTRAVAILTRADEDKMSLWGVRFVIADEDLAIGRQVLAMPVPDMPALRLYELPDPNLGDYSPTRLLTAPDFATGLGLMRDPDFDGRADVVVSDDLADGTLVAARRARLVYQPHGFDLHAESDGRSVLVLPVQFSHCWRASGAGNPELFRANLMQLGVLFEGSLDARLEFRFGPGWSSLCRLDDLRDVERLGIRNARPETAGSQ